MFARVPAFIRLRALVSSRGDVAEAQAGLLKAIEIARRQEAKSWELQAMISLGRLLMNPPKSCALLAAVILAGANTV